MQDNSPKSQLTQNFLGQLTQFSGQFTQFSGQLTQLFGQFTQTNWTIHPNIRDNSPKNLSVYNGLYNINVTKKKTLRLRLSNLYRLLTRKLLGNESEKFIKVFWRSTIRLILIAHDNSL